MVASELELEHPALPVTMGTADARVTVPPGDAVNGEGDHPSTEGPNAHTPRMPRTEDELRTADPLLQSFTGADRNLHGVFGDTIHHNDGRHLDGGIGEDEDHKWQWLHERIVAARLPLYSLPNGQWAKQFLVLQTALWHDVRMRGCNLEKASIFVPLILRRIRSKKTMSEVKMLVWSRMDAWEAGRYCALVKEVEECAMKDGFPHAHTNRRLELEFVGRRFNSMVHSGKLRAAVWAMTDRNPGGLYAPDDICTKTGHRVLDVLREKHPDARIPKENAFDHYANSAEVLDEAMPIACYEEQISLQAANLREGAGPCGVDGTMLKEGLLRHEVSSEHLREEMAHWVVWLCNDSPPFAAYRAVNSAQMLVADKKPGVRPLACGEIWMRLWADFLNTETKAGATTACGNVNLCAGLRAGIEGNLHAVRAVWLHSAGWERDGGEVTAPMPATEGTSMAVTRATDPGKAADVSRSRYVPDSGFGTALFDTKNGFNEVNRYLMLWTAAHRWTKGKPICFQPLPPPEHSLCPRPAW